MPVFVETIDIGAPAPNYNDGSDDLDSPALPTRDNTVTLVKIQNPILELLNYLLILTKKIELKKHPSR